MPKYTISVVFDGGPVELSGYYGIQANFNLGKVTGNVGVTQEVTGGDAFVVRYDAAGRMLGKGDNVAAVASSYNDFALYFTPDGSVSSGTLGSIKFASVLNGVTTVYEYVVNVAPKAGTSGNDNIYGGASNDVLNGLAGKDGLWGRGGNDTLYGGAGDDYLVGGVGADSLDGGASFDTVGYDDAKAGVRVDLSAPSVNTGDAAGDRYVGIERIVGSTYADTLSGDAGANDLQGSDGNDSIAGRDGNDSLGGGAGADTLYGDAGSDSLSGDAGDDWLVGGAGADTLSGGTGVDTASYENSTSAIVVDLLLGGLLSSGDARGDSYVSIENIAGTRFGDLLSGNLAANGFDGLAGSDTILGLSGNDTLRGGDGNDILLGGDNDDRLSGGADDDTLTGGSGNDLVQGDDGDDLIFGDAGKDTIDGGAGNDTLSFEGSLAKIRLELLAPKSNSGDAAGDVVSNIETIIGTLLGNDTIAGDALNNTIFGRGGVDSLFGRDGNDVLYGEMGNDYLLGENGNDTLFGGAGNDTFVFSAGWGNDIIADFDDGQDRLSFAGMKLKFASFVITQIDADKDGLKDDVHIALASDPLKGPSIDLLDFTLAKLTSADFIF